MAMGAGLAPLVYGLIPFVLLGGSGLSPGPLTGMRGESYLNLSRMKDESGAAHGAGAPGLDSETGD